MYVQALPKVYPNFVQNLAIGVPNIPGHNIEPLKKFMPKNQQLNLSILKDQYDQRIFNFANKQSHFFTKSLPTYASALAELKNHLDRAQGKGQNPWTLTIIDYYGPGCTLRNGSKSQIAILPIIQKGQEPRFKLIDLDHVASDFAQKDNSVTFIFNHSSTEEMTHQDYRWLMGKDQIEDQKIDETDEKKVKEREIQEMFYFYDIEEEVIDVPVKKEEEEEKKTKPKELTQVKVRDDFGLDFTEQKKPKGLAVLVNLNLGLNKRESVSTQDELLRHIKMIQECTQQQLYQLEFLDNLPCGSYRIFYDQPRDKIPVHIFKSQNIQVSNQYIRELHQKRKAEILRQLVQKAIITQQFAAECVQYDIEETKIDTLHFELQFWNGIEVVKTLIVKTCDLVFPQRDEAMWRQLGLHNYSLLREDDFSGVTLIGQQIMNQEEKIDRMIVEDRRKIENAGIIIPEDGHIQSFPTCPKVHQHHMFKCEPVRFDWKCKGQNLQYNCFSGMTKEKKSQHESFYCFETDDRYCQACFYFYVTVQPPTPIPKLIVANIRSLPKRLYRFTKTQTSNKLHYHDQFIRVGNKNLLHEVTEFDHRYQLNFPQIVQIDEKYFCLIGGTQKPNFDFDTPSLPVVQIQEIEEEQIAQQEFETFVIMDSVSTKDRRRLSAYRWKMPEYTHHAACGVMWKKALYIAGGEIEGRWSNKVHKFDFETFGFQNLEDIPSILKMASLAPVHDESLGFFIAGQNQNGLAEIQFYSDQFNNWQGMQDKDGNDLYYREESVLTSGFPALKFFSNSKNSDIQVKGYLLVAGGLDPLSNTVSSNVKLYLIILKKYAQEWNLDAKLVFENESVMQESDFFPHNQWVSTDEDSNNPQSAKKSYLILGSKGIHSFKINIEDEKNPTVTSQIEVPNFKLF